jgi:hypothetical protein
MLFIVVASGLASGRLFSSAIPHQTSARGVRRHHAYRTFSSLFGGYPRHSLAEGSGSGSSRTRRNTSSEIRLESGQSGQFCDLRRASPFLRFTNIHTFHQLSIMIIEPLLLSVWGLFQSLYRPFTLQDGADATPMQNTMCNDTVLFDGPKASPIGMYRLLERVTSS